MAGDFCERSIIEVWALPNSSQRANMLLAFHFTPNESQVQSILKEKKGNAVLLIHTSEYYFLNEY